MPRGRNVYDEARLQGRLWTPALLPVPPWGWYDFSDYPSTTGGAEYQEVRNRGRGGPALSQATLAARPLRVTGPGGLPVADFDGANDAISSGVTWFANGAMTFAAVYNPAAIGAFFVIGNGGSGASSSRKYLWTSGCDFGNTLLTNPALVANQWTVAVADVAGTSTTTQRHWANGGSPVSGGLTNNNQNNILALASYNGATGYTDIQIAEVVIIPAQLSEPARQSLEGYFAHKWGLSGLLPAAHPYRNRPPMIGN